MTHKYALLGLFAMSVAGASSLHATDVMDSQEFGAGMRKFSYYSQDPTVDGYGKASEGLLPGHFSVVRDYLQNDAFKIMTKGSYKMDEKFEKGQPLVFDPITEANDFLAAHTFYVLNSARNRMGADLNMLKKTNSGSKAIGEKIKLWDISATEQTEVEPKQRVGRATELNAWYSRSKKHRGGADRSLTFLYSKPTYTALSTDIVHHEFGHEETDIIQPSFYDSQKVEPGALHEWSGDAFALFNSLSDLSVVRNVWNQTGGDMHRSNDAGAMAESFGKALKMKYLRNADRDISISEAGTEVHDLSEVGMGALYDVLASAVQQTMDRNHASVYDGSYVLLETARYARLLWTATLVEITQAEPTLGDVGTTFQRVSHDYKFANSLDLEKFDWASVMGREMERRGVNMTPNGQSVVGGVRAVGKQGICGRAFGNLPGAKLDKSSDSSKHSSDDESIDSVSHK